MSTKPGKTQATVEHHLQAFFRGSLDGVVEDYARDAVMIIAGGALRGVPAIREFFGSFMEKLPPGFLQAFNMHRQEFAGELGYIVWDAAPWVEFATDSFVVRDGKIVLQTFAVHPTAWVIGALGDLDPPRADAYTARDALLYR